MTVDPAFLTFSFSRATDDELVELSRTSSDPGILREMQIRRVNRLVPRTSRMAIGCLYAGSESALPLENGERVTPTRIVEDLVAGLMVTDKDSRTALERDHHGFSQMGERLVRSALDRHHDRSGGKRQADAAWALGMSIYRRLVEQAEAAGRELSDQEVRDATGRGIDQMAAAIDLTEALNLSEPEDWIRYQQSAAMAIRQHGNAGTAENVIGTARQLYYEAKRHRTTPLALKQWREYQSNVGDPAYINSLTRSPWGEMYWGDGTPAISDGKGGYKKLSAIERVLGTRIGHIDWTELQVMVDKTFKPSDK